MRTDSDNPWWLCAALTALPVTLAAFLVATFPPGPRIKAASSRPGQFVTPPMIPSEQHDWDVCIVTPGIP